jgi:hypothetical protein
MNGSWTKGAVRCATQFACVVFLAGCYRYAPAQLEEVAPGTEVRTQLSGIGVERLRQGEGMSRLLDGFSVTGKLAEIRSDGVVLSVPNTIIQADYRARVLTQNLFLARSEVVRTEIRRLDAKKTALFGAVGLAIAAFIVVDQLSGEAGASGGIPGGGGPAESLVGYGFRWAPR